MSPHPILDAAVGTPNFAQIFGPVFWGFCISLILCGVSVMQGYLYFTRYNDKLWIRLFAGGMITLDFISMALISQSMYYYMLPHFGSFAPLSAVTPELTVECLISAMLTFGSQMYFAYQLFIIRRPGIIAKLANASVVILGTFGLAGGIGCAVMMFMFPQEVFANRNHTFAILAGISKGFGAAADIVATIAMCLFLSAADTGLTRTSGMLKTIMHLFINRGILVTIAQIGLLITFFATSNHLYWLAFHVNTTKLYVNTFFAMLNARNSVRSAHGQVSRMTESTNHGGVSAIKYSPREKLEDYELDSPGFEKATIHVTTTSTTAAI
ncbi:hypothetical protein C8F04DRAFT_340054 [Mycena alexandri]|uniref:DUF6534 domain-containing protein n=1 Tax=Mycena alexandri TaxID=1745969 RepID=A0AAD6XFI1_9AGAR|nr:hypothetical protein C8F04DRAFT_340054 [Mycena alexandri]